MKLSASVELDELARLTDGYSGADLQALIYNAHLDVIHSSIPASGGNSTPAQDEVPVQFVKLGGQGQKTLLSRAEETAMQRRVCLPSLIYVLIQSLYIARPNALTILDRVARFSVASIAA
jgi:SpoVK/Ycf46/Vps4 family AAA+-type ATPase